MKIYVSPRTERRDRPMTRDEIRDHYAGLAMQALLSTCDVWVTDDDQQHIAVKAWCMAARMMLERDEFYGDTPK